MKHTFYSLAAGIMVCLCGMAQASVYHCVVNGQNVYTNKPNGNCQTAKLDKLGSYTSDKAILARQNELSNAKIAAANEQSQSAASAKTRTTPASTTQQANAQTAKPATTQAVAHRPQTQRDQGRREILMSELSNEKKALAQARLALTNGKLIRSDNNERQQQSLASLQRAVDDRMQNVQALQNELSRM